MIGVILCVLMVLVAVQAFWATVTYYHSHKIRELIFPICIIITTDILITFFRLVRREGANVVLSRYGLGPASIYISYIAAFVLCVVTLIFLVIELFRMSREITGASIKEGADILPAGLLYYDDSGIIIIANKAMHEIAESYMGKTLLSGVLFWDEVKELTGAEVSFEEGKETVTVTFENGRTWTFVKERIDAEGEQVNQVYAMDTTSLLLLQRELQTENERLSSMNGRLRAYGESVTELTRDEEILSAKVRIHDDLGEALLATRYYLTENRIPKAAEGLVKTWAKNISLLRHETVREDNTDPLIQIINAGETIGLLVVVNGNLPKENIKVLRLINAAARECMTNSVKHAGASEMYIDIKEEGAFYSVSFSDNGQIKEGFVMEGGGLSGLRSQVEKAYGIMETSFTDGFKLTVMIPK